MHFKMLHMLIEEWEDFLFYSIKSTTNFIHDDVYLKKKYTHLKSAPVHILSLYFCRITILSSFHDENMYCTFLCDNLSSLLLHP